MEQFFLCLINLMEIFLVFFNFAFYIHGHFITLWVSSMKSVAVLSSSQWQTAELLDYLERHFITFDRFYIVWHLWHYRFPREWWRKRKTCTGKEKTHAHTEEDLSTLILLFLMCLYFLAFIFRFFFFICICCSLISVKHFLTNLFDKSTSGINQAWPTEENKGRGKTETERRESTGEQQIEGKSRTENTRRGLKEGS